MINCEYSPANVQRKDIASKYFRHFFYISRLEITRSRGQVSRSRGQVFDLFPKDKNRETEVSQRGFRFFFLGAKGSGSSAPPAALVASRWGQDLTRKSLATLRQCQTPVRGGFPGERTWCEAVFLVRGGFLGDYGDGGEII